MREWEGTHRNCYYICTHVSPEILYAIKLTPTTINSRPAKPSCLRYYPGRKDCTRFPSVVNDLNVNATKRPPWKRRKGWRRVEERCKLAGGYYRALRRVFVCRLSIGVKTASHSNGSPDWVMTIDMGDRDKHYNKIDTVPDGIEPFFPFSFHFRLLCHIIDFVILPLTLPPFAPPFLRFLLRSIFRFRRPLNRCRCDTFAYKIVIARFKFVSPMHRNNVLSLLSFVSIPPPASVLLHFPAYLVSTSFSIRHRYTATAIQNNFTRLRPNSLAKTILRSLVCGRVHR